MLEGMKAEGQDPAKVLDQYIQLYNDCVRDAPADMVIGLHLCRGNFKVRRCLRIRIDEPPR